MIIKKDYEQLLINPNDSLIIALNKLNKGGKKILFVTTSDNVLLGTLTDGDIRRYIIKNAKLEGTISEIYNQSPYVLYEDNFNKDEAINIFKKQQIEIIPIINNKKHLIGYIEWSDFLTDEDTTNTIYTPIEQNICTIIMAGGKGTRLKPFTDIIPKALIPLGDKTAIEYIISNLQLWGINKFYLTLNYKGQLIETYFKTINKDYDINFIWENKFLGTAGALKILEEQDISENFIVCNCDIILKSNLKKIIEFHINNKAVLTSITSISNYKIPYGVVNTYNGGQIQQVIEKPEYIFQINTGFYVLNKQALKFLSKDEYCDMPYLINILVQNKQKVLAYPITENDYIDIGEWDLYIKGVSKIYDK